MAELHLVRTSPVERAMQRHAWRTRASVAELNEAIAARIEDGRRRARRRQLLERVAAAISIFLCWFLILLDGGVGWQLALGCALTVTALLVAVFLAAERMAPEDPGRVRGGWRRR